MELAVKGVILEPVHLESHGLVHALAAPGRLALGAVGVMCVHDDNVRCPTMIVATAVAVVGVAFVRVAVPAQVGNVGSAGHGAIVGVGFGFVSGSGFGFETETHGG